jgi:hypothetical protein
MDESALSVLIGLMLVVIIIESTALATTLNLSAASSPIPFTKITPVSTASADTNQEVSFQAAPALVAGEVTATQTTNPSPVIVNSKLRSIQGSSVVQPAILPVSKVEYVTHDDPIPADNYNVSDHLMYVPVPQPTIDEPEYVEIFNKNMSFEYNSTAISFNLVNPPMVISYNVTPRIVNLEKWVVNRDAGKKIGDGKIINVTRCDENSWFQVTAFDKNQNNTIVLQDGFGKEHDQAMTKELVIRDPGNYQLKFEGDFITVQASVKVPREENIPL